MSHILLSFLFFNILLAIFWSHYKRGDYYIDKRNLIFYTILLIGFGTYGGGEGDYLHYAERVKLYKSIFDVYYYDMMEIQYNYLAYILDGNYDLWRFVIFSIQFIGMSWFLYKAKLNTYPVYLCFVSYCLIISVYNRSFWGPIYFFMGMYLLLEKRNPLYLVVVALCYFSHTQNIALLLLLPLAFIDFRKWQIILVLLLSSFIVSVFRENFIAIFESGGIENDYINKKVSEYSESSLGAFGNSIGEMTIFALRYIPMAMIIVSIISTILKDRMRYMSYYQPYRKVMNITVGLVFVALIILFASISGGTIFYRILAMALFPISILLPYLRNVGAISQKSFDRYVKIFIICSEISYIKDVYYADAGGNI